MAPVFLVGQLLSFLMERKEFLQLFGVGATLLLTGCLGGCVATQALSTDADANDDPDADSRPAIAPGLDLRLDLTDENYTALQDLKRGFVYVAGGRVIVAKTLANNYVAVAATCPHAGDQILYRRRQNKFQCPSHGSVFEADGTLLEGPSQRGLQHFRVTQTGNVLHIWG